MIPRPARKSFVSPWGVRRLKNWDFANGTGDVKAEVPPFLDLREHPLASIQWRTWQVRKTASDLLDVWPTMMKFDEFDKKFFFGIVVSLIMNSSKKCDNYISHCLNFFLCTSKPWVIMHFARKNIDVLHECFKRKFYGYHLCMKSNWVRSLIIL